MELTPVGVISPILARGFSTIPQYLGTTVPAPQKCNKVRELFVQHGLSKTKGRSPFQWPERKFGIPVLKDIVCSTTFLSLC